MNSLGNPYHDRPDPLITRKVVAQVGEEDWNHFNRALPYRGNQDQIISSLFYIFIKQLKAEGIPPHYDIDNHSRIEGILGRITFLPAPGSRDSEPHRRAEAGAFEGGAGETSLTTETPVRRSEDGEETFWKENRY